MMYVVGDSGRGCGDPDQMGMTVLPVSGGISLVCALGSVLSTCATTSAIYLKDTEIPHVFRGQI